MLPADGVTEAKGETGLPLKSLFHEKKAYRNEQETIQNCPTELLRMKKMTEIKNPSPKGH